VSRKYPDSEYAQNAKTQDRGRARPARRQGDGHRALHLKRKDFTGAINRFKIVVTQYQTTGTSRRR
jgi:outer membrane protein assembly factor BamD